MPGLTHYYDLHAYFRYNVYLRKPSAAEQERRRRRHWHAARFNASRGGGAGGAGGGGKAHLQVETPSDGTRTHETIGFPGWERTHPPTSDHKL